MRESLSWLHRHKTPQTEVVMFDPADPTNPMLLSVLERYANTAGFDNTLARVLIERQRQENSNTPN